ncbi:MAG TPA: diacylglycerol kinase family protein [Fimbriiglobus sp.]
MPAILPRPTLLMDPSTDDPPRTRRRKWQAKFGYAFRGIKRGMRGHSSFSVHFFAAASVLAGAIVFQCNWTEWCILLGAVGFVFVAELFNSAVEALFHGQDDAVKSKNYQALDIAAGAVLVASIFAAAVGLIVFGRRVWMCYAN